MNNNPNENLNQQPVVDNNSQAVNNVDPTTVEMVSPVEQTTSVTSDQVVQPASASVQVDQSISQIESVAPPEQKRVKLVDDKPGIQAVMPNNNVSINTVSDDKNIVSENTEILEVVEEPIEELKESPEVPKKGGKLQTFFLFVLFGGLLLIVIFLPDISNYIETQKYLKTQNIEKITTGTLSCERDYSSNTLDYTYSLDFGFTDSKLTRLTYVLETRGDANLDAEVLDGMKTECEKLAISSKQLSGISVYCKLEHGTLMQKQVLNYSSIVVDEAITAYMEAGGVYPDYKDGESIDTIEKEMNASGYRCERIK